MKMAEKQRAVVITQNVPLMREALGYEQYFKTCTSCDVGVTTQRRTLRKCPRCGGRLVKTDATSRISRLSNWREQSKHG